MLFAPSIVEFCSEQVKGEKPCKEYKTTNNMTEATEDRKQKGKSYFSKIVT